MTDFRRAFQVLNADIFALHLAPGRSEDSDDVAWHISFMPPRAQRLIVVGVLSAARDGFDLNVGVSAYVELDESITFDVLRAEAEDLFNAALAVENLYDLAAQSAKQLLALTNNELEIPRKAPHAEVALIEETGTSPEEPREAASDDPERA